MNDIYISTYSSYSVYSVKAITAEDGKRRICFKLDSFLGENGWEEAEVYKLFNVKENFEGQVILKERFLLPKEFVYENTSDMS